MLACLAAVSNCELHAAFDSSFQGSLTCLRCGKQYVLNPDTGLCANPNVEKCDYYFQNGGQCEICQPGYFLDDAGKCVSAGTIDKCTQYDPRNPKTCLRCEAGFQAFLLRNQCTLSNPLIAQCTAYSKDGSRCTACAAGFYLSGGLECKAKPENCGQVGYDGSCVQCNAGFALLGGVCQSWPIDFMSPGSVDGLNVSNCYGTDGQRIRLAGSDFPLCAHCAMNHFPFRFEGLALCMKANQF